MTMRIMVSDGMPERVPSQQASPWDSGEEKAPPHWREYFRLDIIHRDDILDGAEIHVHAASPPWDIQAQINDIFKREISEKRGREIADIAKITSLHFADIRHEFNAQDDLIEVLYEGLRMMQNDDVFGFLRKADCEQSGRRIVVRQKEGNTDAPNQSNNDVEDAVDGLSKVRLREPSLPSSNTSQPITALSVAAFQLQQDAIKTPCPGFIVGFGLSAVSNALVKRGLSELQADKVLKSSERVRKFCSDPMHYTLNVVYPTLMIEGGENQFGVCVKAAVSGAVLVNLRHHLIDRHASLFPDLQNEKTPFIGAFSININYGLIELWVHYTLMKDNVRYHHANVLNLCSASLSDQLEMFLLLVDRVMQWTKEEILNEYADQLCGWAVYDMATLAAQG